MLKLLLLGATLWGALANGLDAVRCDGDAVYPHPKSSRLYSKCENGRLTTKFCGIGEKFSTESGSCVHGSDVRCKDGDSRPSVSCVSYKVCKNGDWIESYCPLYHTYDPIKLMCVRFTEYKCPVSYDEHNLSPLKTETAHRPHHASEPEPTHKSHPRTEPTDEPYPETEPTDEPYPETEPTDEPYPETEPTHRSHAETEPTHKSHPRTEPTDEPYPETEPTHKSYPETEPTREPHPKTEPTHDPHPETEPTHKHHPETEPTHKHHPETEPTHEPHPKTEPTHKSDPRTEPTPTPGPTPCKQGEKKPVSGECRKYQECVEGKFKDDSCFWPRKFDSVNKECVWFGATCA